MQVSPGGPAALRAPVANAATRSSVTIQPRRRVSAFRRRRPGSAAQGRGAARPPAKPRQESQQVVPLHLVGLHGHPPGQSYPQFASAGLRSPYRRSGDQRRDMLRRGSSTSAGSRGPGPSTRPRGIGHRPTLASPRCREEGPASGASGGPVADPRPGGERCDDDGAVAGVPVPVRHPHVKGVLVEEHRVPPPSAPPPRRGPPRRSPSSASTRRQPHRRRRRRRPPPWRPEPRW